MDDKTEMGQRLEVTVDADRVQVIPGPERIVRALAAGRAPYDDIGGGCWYCGIEDLPLAEDAKPVEEHMPDCLWRLAKEWDAANPG